MTKILLGIILVLAVIYVVPFIVYGLFSSLIGAKMPEGVSPLHLSLYFILPEIHLADIGSCMLLFGG